MIFFGYNCYPTLASIYDKYIVTGWNILNSFYFNSSTFVKLTLRRQKSNSENRHSNNNTSVEFLNYNRIFIVNNKTISRIRVYIFVSNTLRPPSILTIIPFHYMYKPLIYFLPIIFHTKHHFVLYFASFSTVSYGGFVYSIIRSLNCFSGHPLSFLLIKYFLFLFL